jgi:signal transduction histidine kinase
VLVSLMDTRRNVEMLTTDAAARTSLRVPYAQNSLVFRFFSGSYAWRRTPTYEFRLNPVEPWATLDTGSLLRFPGLHEGRYRLQVRIAGDPGPPGPPFMFPFEVLPPWHRTWPAYLLYAALVVLAGLGAMRWSSYLARRRNRALEQIVHERTAELESAMAKLNDETRVSATLAERDRLAGEIHDSVQQGLSGAILQLDTTLKLPVVTGDVRARLNVVRNMVSYARQEVQHAVWDMDSPLLEDNDLGAALRKLATFVNSDRLVPSVVVSGPPLPLPRATTHHLLRMAQEATMNAMRHARAHVIEIRLEYRPDAVGLAITDDGIGFHPEDVLTQAGHFGLRGIRTRARKLHGVVNIISSPGQGTAIRVLVPLTPETPLPSDAEASRLHEDPNPACR